MRRALARYGVLVTFFLVLAPPATVARSKQPTGNPRTRPTSMTPVPRSIEAFALRASGRVVRRDDRITVERIELPGRLAASNPEVAPSLFRVTVKGRFPPRALRYVVLADGRPIGFGVPGAFGAVRAVTADPAVLVDRLTVRYGTGSAAAPAAAPVSSIHAPTGGYRPDSATSGPYAVTKRVYDFGNQVLQLPGLKGKVEMTADVHYPSGLHGGPYPLVLFLHGNHYSCFKGVKAAYTWPCPAGWQPLPNYAGYDYIARRLASYGFIVVSVSANGVNVLGNQVGDTGMRQRGELLERHIDRWRMWDTVGGAPFGRRFVGKVDLSRIGTMGHSRGGEGAIWNVIVDRERAVPYGIDAVLALAPVDFDRTTVNDVPLAVMLPYCDGDVSDLEGMHYFDDARYREPGDPTPKDTVTVYGADHNFFNTVWSPGGGYPGAFDDGNPRCPHRLTEAQQRRVGVAYVVSFFRRYLTHTMSLDSIWTGRTTPASIAPARALRQLPGARHARAAFGSGSLHRPGEHLHRPARRDGSCAGNVPVRLVRRHLPARLRPGALRVQ